MKMLSRMLLWGALLGLPWMLCSCRTGVTASGDPCYELSGDELEELVAIARMSLRKPRRQLTPAETHAIMTSAPEVVVIYNGDCSGEVKIRWTLPEKRAGVRYRGLLNDPKRRSMVFEIIPDNDRTIYKGVPGRKDTVVR